MSFKFNFGVSDDGENITGANVIADEQDQSHDVDMDTSATVEPTVALPLSISSVPSLVVDAIYFKDQKLWKRRIDDIQFQLAQEDMMEAEHSSTLQRMMAEGKDAADVIKGVYEGGLKTWECSIDLLNYLIGDENGIAALDGARVLELGCGTALPSLHILKRVPTAQVCLQDYNKDVLELVTIPNVLANTVLSPEDGVAGDKLHVEDDTETCEIDIDFRRTQILFGELADETIGNREVPELTAEEVAVANERLLAAGSGIQDRCEFVAGDWSYMQESIEAHGRQNSFDLILTSETIYDTASYRKLHDLIAATLAKPQQTQSRPPMALVAAKSIYFGLTGSVLSFRKYVQTRGVFSAETVWQSGGSMNREILRLTWV